MKKSKKMGKVESKVSLSDMGFWVDKNKRDNGGNDVGNGRDNKKRLRFIAAAEKAAAKDRKGER